MARKYLIIGEEVVMGDVEMHYELIGEHEGKIVGGGRWNIDKMRKRIYFYGTCQDYGSVTRDQLMTAWHNTDITGYDVYFSHREYFSDVLSEKGLNAID